MHLPEIHRNNINEFLNKEDIILETIKQIMKDFGMFGLEITFSGNIEKAYSEIHKQLTIQVEHLFNENISKLYAILYQVDISNKTIEKAQDNMPDFTLIEVVAHQIIIRDLQKVLTRRYFSQNKP